VLIIDPIKEAASKPLRLAGEAFDLQAMQRAADRACGLMKVLSNPDRLLILCQLSLGEKNVGNLELTLGITQPTLSQQLTILRAESLVSTRREGKNMIYKIASPEALAVMNVLYECYCNNQAEPT
jgi:DNA-binding transcriptional ArsR family regulator